MNEWLGAVVNSVISKPKYTFKKENKKSSMRGLEETMIISKYESLQECKKWMKEIPALHFEKEWNVKIIPPFGGAVIRFWIDYNGKHVSVYFDAYDELGCVGEPYFEFYDGEECYRYYMNESEEMMEDIKNFLNN